MNEHGCFHENDIVALAEGRAPAELIVKVDDHVACCSSCRLVLAASLRSQDSERSETGRSRWHSLVPGEIVGDRYRIERFLGRGGMAEVYEASDLLLHERVALKTLAAALSDDPQATLRLRHEVQIARRVTHPNVCRLFDLGIHRYEYAAGKMAESTIFITMELLSGETLGQRLKRVGRIGETEAQSIVEQLVLGLEAAHRAGVVHRDFKCDNIMLVQGPLSSERVVVTDFGLARAKTPDGGSGRWSTPGALLGTIAYMAPEQLLGGDVTTSTDIYALGVVMYEMVTGHLPWQTNSIPADPAIRLTELPRSPVALTRDLSRRFESVVLKCLSRNPIERFSSVGDVGRALQGTPAVRTTTDLRASKVSVPRGARLSTGVGLVVAIGILVARSYASPKHEVHVQTPSSRQPAVEHPERTDGSLPKVTNPTVISLDKRVSAGPEWRRAIKGEPHAHSKFAASPKSEPLSVSAGAPTEDASPSKPVKALVDDNEILDPFVQNR